VHSETGDVFVAKILERDVASVVTLTVVVTDNSANPKQQATGRQIRL